MKKPVIGILAVRTEPPNRVGSIPFVGINESYSLAVTQAGGIPFLLPLLPDADLLQLMEHCDGLLVPGGIDVDPAFYNQEPHPLLGTVDRKMDLNGFAAVQYAVAHHLPILGICRGMQLVNVALGGSLYQDLSCTGLEVVQHMQKSERAQAVHSVSVVSGCQTALLLGETIQVNSFHHQAVDKPGKGLTVTAYAADGIAEAMENEDKSILLVQWHPENLRSSQPDMDNLFRHLVSLAAK